MVTLETGEGGGLIISEGVILQIVHPRRPSGLVGNLAHLLVQKSWVRFLSKRDFYSGVRSGKRENASNKMHPLLVDELLECRIRKARTEERWEDP